MQKQSKIGFQLSVANYQDWERELSRSFNRGTILVVDVFTDLFGSCKVVVPYLQKIYLEHNEECPMRFITLNSDLVIQSLIDDGIPIHSPPAATKKLVGTPRSIGAEPETDEDMPNQDELEEEDIIGGEEEEVPPSPIAPFNGMDRSWIPMFDSYRKKSCPRFLFYYEGKLIENVKGVDISKIHSTLKTMIAKYFEEYGKVSQRDDNEHLIGEEDENLSGHFSLTGADDLE